MKHLIAFWLMLDKFYVVLACALAVIITIMLAVG